MKHLIKEAYLRVYDGYSTDYVLADPVISNRFLEECKVLGLEESPSDLFRKLLNLRKNNQLKNIKTKRAKIEIADECLFAAEVVARYLEQREKLASTDVLISTPRLLQEFDALVQEVSPGYSTITYRWALLRLRKTRQLKPEIISRVVCSTSVTRFSLKDVQESEIPCEQGIYIFLSKNEVLYVGEAENLQNRLRKHLSHSDNKWLARWFWEFGLEHAFLEIHVLEKSTKTKVRRALEMEFIQSRKPKFNVKNLPIV